MEGHRGEDVRVSIGAVCEATGLSQRQVRYLERAGLITAERSAGGQRRYTLEGLATLRRIAELRRQGKSLGRIARILATTVRRGSATPGYPADLAGLVDAQVYFNVRREDQD